MVSNLDGGRPLKPGRSWSGRPPPVHAQAVLYMTASALVVFLAADVMGPATGITGTASVAGLMIFSVIGFLALRYLHLYPHGAFGPANATTTFRAALAAGIGGIVAAALPSSQAPLSSTLWIVTGVAAVFLGLDGVDGHLARKSGTVSRYGARFDMEVDAFLILLLSALAALAGKAGPWVLMIGLMRYAFVLAQWLIPRMRGDLRDSWRRKLICVLQGAALAVALMPIVPHALSAPLLGLALALLFYSFTADVTYLLNDRKITGEA
ncbi:CDP-alcohol phosphatidyltransferase family protein [Pseudorhizobium endolithicum]|uniref:CDP-alcohol phosphatidyltransferase family protein n=2 Tax=Pseudorhizobium endolithicum TaxID=1191678 RepID=A0ABN7JPL5_9HYPH|nr:CDP-alcohol phosphatidyltransferase family protein [Pseudorhizobium endolithicum]